MTRSSSPASNSPALVDLPDTTLGELVGRAATRDGDRVALVDGESGGSVTHAELWLRVDRIASWLAGGGTGRGDVVGIWAPNLPAWGACALAAMELGAAVTGIGDGYGPHEATPQLRLSSTVVTTPARVADVIAAGVRRVLALGEAPAATSLGDVLRARAGAVPRATDPSATALLPFSSGTSGLPKGVRLDHRNLVAGVLLTNRALELGPSDVVLALPPFAHVLGGVVGLLCPLTAGCCVVTLPGFSPTDLLDAVERYGVTLMAVPPTVARVLAEHPAVPDRDLRSLRLIAVGGAPLPPRVQARLEDRLPGCVVGQGYGLTETTGSVCVPTPRASTPPGSVGRPVAGTELRVVDPATGTDRAAGEAGELWVRGPQVMRGYLDEEATRTTLTQDGWLRTGDLCRIEESGDLVVLDRLKELIKVAGFQVAPAEVESVLLEHPGVRDAVVVGRPDERRGEVPIAFVVGEPDPAALAAWVAARLAPYKRPVEYRVVDGVPRTPSGKLQRRLVGRLLGQPLGRPLGQLLRDEAGAGVSA